MPSSNRRNRSCITRVNSPKYSTTRRVEARASTSGDNIRTGFELPGRNIHIWGFIGKRQLLPTMIAAGFRQNRSRDKVGKIAGSIEVVARAVLRTRWSRLRCVCKRKMKPRGPEMMNRSAIIACCRSVAEPFPREAVVLKRTPGARPSNAREERWGGGIGRATI